MKYLYPALAIIVAISAVYGFTTIPSELRKGIYPFVMEQMNIQNRRMDDIEKMQSKVMYFLTHRNDDLSYHLNIINNYCALIKAKYE